MSRTTRISAGAVLAFAAVFALSACGNTIRGMGKDTANTVNATQNAGHRVGNAAAN